MSSKSACFHPWQALTVHYEKDPYQAGCYCSKKVLNKSTNHSIETPLTTRSHWQNLFNPTEQGRSLEETDLFICLWFTKEPWTPENVSLCVDTYCQSLSPEGRERTVSGRVLSHRAAKRANVAAITAANSQLHKQLIPLSVRVRRKSTVSIYSYLSRTKQQCDSICILITLAWVLHKQWELKNV